MMVVAYMCATACHLKHTSRHWLSTAASPPNPAIRVGYRERRVAQGSIRCVRGVTLSWSGPARQDSITLLSRRERSPLEDNPFGWWWIPLYPWISPPNWSAVWPKDG